MDSNKIVKIENLVREYKVGEGIFTALNNINLTFDKGAFAGLVGPSGSGKTTLLNIIGSLDKPTKGKAIVMGKDVAQLSHKESARLRNFSIGFIFQTYNLLPVYTVYENVQFPLILQNKNPIESKKAVMQALEWVGLVDEAQKKPAKLSGGQAQRVSIARAIVKKPELILADEPTANLDAENAYTILDIMKKINKELNTTFIFSTHDQKVMEYFNRIIRLEDGKVSKDEFVKPKKGNI